jgi:hypothetical protein
VFSQQQIARIHRVRGRLVLTTPHRRGIQPFGVRMRDDSAYLLFCAHILDWRNPFAAILG